MCSAVTYLCVCFFDHKLAVPLPRAFATGGAGCTGAKIDGVEGRTALDVQLLKLGSATGGDDQFEEGVFDITMAIVDVVDLERRALEHSIAGGCGVE